MGVMANVIVDEAGVRRRLHDGSTESIQWETLDEVAVVTTSDGPMGEDVFFVLREGDDGCVVPQGVAVEVGLLAWLQRLPGFRNDLVIEAMGSCDERRFVCWARYRAKSA